mmetsp:Transcript_27101/g.45777  ORF Transcript_27101/g.45777 Transcript_27101/m.45777 type:complete len:80 (-) Transcript_27101:229-468(-)
MPWQDIVVLLNICIHGDADQVPPEHLQHFLSSWIDYVKKHPVQMIQRIFTATRRDDLYNEWYKLINDFKGTYSHPTSVN